MRPVLRNPKPGGDPVDYGREGQILNRLLACAREAGALGDEAAVELVLARVANVARLTKSVRLGGEWGSEPLVHRLDEVEAVFARAAQPATAEPGRRPDGPRHGVSDWAAEAARGGSTEGRTLTADELAQVVAKVGGGV